MKTAAKICNIVATVMIILVILVALPMVVPRVIGYEMYGVLSGSMEPTFPVGSVVYVKPSEPSEIQVQDAITFRIGEDVVATHRVIEIDEQAQSFVTKGDANKDKDLSPIKFDRLIGKAVFCIPYLGSFSQFIQSQGGMIAGGGIIVVVIALWLVADILNKKARREQDE